MNVDTVPVNSKHSGRKGVLLAVIGAVVLGGLLYVGSSALSKHFDSGFPSHWTEQDFYMYTEVSEVMQDQGYLNGSDLDKETFERVFFTKDLSLFSVAHEGQSYLAINKNGSWYFVKTS